MVTKTLETVVNDLERYFQTSHEVKVSEELNAGISTIALHLASSKDPEELGSNAVDRALVMQWVEYASLYNPYFINKSQVVTLQVLKELNEILARQSFIVKNNRTVADIVLFYVLWNTMASLSFQEKEQYINLSRWFNNLQQDDRLRQSKVKICFSRTLLY